MLRKRIIRVNGKRNVPHTLSGKPAVKEARFTLQTPGKGAIKPKNGTSHPANGGLQPPQPVAPVVVASPDAITIDSTGLTVEGTVDKIMKLIQL